jgi:hypothetical protein
MANRGSQQKVEHKKDKPLSLGLMDADGAIMYYLANVIKPQVKTAETIETVPIVYANPEKWKSIQKGSFVRDSKGKAQIPVIAYKRTNVEKHLISSKVDVNNPIVQSFQTQFNTRNRYDQFSRLTGQQPVRKYHNVVVPDYVKLTYECVIMTDYIEQMNPIIEDINYAAGQYWGDENSKFLAKIGSYSVDLSAEQGEDRAVKSTFTIEMNGYIVPQNTQKAMSNYQPVSYSPRQVIFTTRVVDDVNNPATDVNANGLQDIDKQSDRTIT